MPIHERKQSGCWTCRIRKKKCDEAYPSCSSCVVRGITCYGYGAKPEWMDGGEKQKEITEELKRVVKENIKQERGNRISRTTPNTTPLQNEQITPPYSSASPPSPEPLPTRGTPANFPLDPYSIQYDYPACLPNPAAVIEHMEGRDVRTFEITLLMNYLDHVFPLQFSCYTPPVTELGRGWLLALLTRTKPLYHAALALSAFHMHSMLLKTNRHTCINGHWEVMRHNHEKAFTELQVQIHELQQEETRSLKGTIETVACIIQLISSELLRGGKGTWRIHLSAAASLIPTLLSHLFRTSPSSSPGARARFRNYTTGPNGSDAPANIDDVACVFLVGVFIWFDILASASTHLPPTLPSSYTYLTSHNIDLSKIMGCENWAMIAIARISELAIWKQEQQNVGKLSVIELTRRGVDIQQGIESRLEDIQRRLGIREDCPDSACCQKPAIPAGLTILVITRIFASSALTYLHSTISGPHPSLPEIEKSVKDTIEGFKLLSGPKMMRNLVWPFVVTACLATGQERVFMEVVMRRMEMGEELDGDGAMGMCAGFGVVREVWRRRDAGEGRGFDWVRGEGEDGAEEGKGRVLLV